MKRRISDKARLSHILDACRKIELATKGYDLDKFLEDFIVKAAVCHFLMIIGEAAATVTVAFKEENQEIDWTLMKGCEIIVHEYFGVDDNKVWETIKGDIPKLIADCENALKKL